MPRHKTDENMQKPPPKRRRSVKLQPAEKRKLADLIEKYGTIEDAATNVGVSRQALSGAKNNGRCAQSTVEKIMAAS